MKNLLLIFLMSLCYIFSIKAQVKKGAVVIGGNAGYARYELETEGNLPDKSTQKYFTVSPAVGVAIKDNLIFGADFIYGSSKGAQTNNSGQVIKTRGAGLFVRKYLELGRRFYLFGQSKLGASYNTQHTDNGSTSYDNKGYSITFGIYPGISYQLNTSWQFEMGINDLIFTSYSHNKQIQKANGTFISESKSKSFNISTTASSLSNLVFGFRFFM